MSVKNIARNLFVSGALALSFGIVCSMSASASTLEQLNSADRIKQLEEFSTQLYRDYLCLSKEKECLLNVLINGNLPDSNSLCINTNDIVACLSQSQKCMGKLNEDYSMNIDDVDVHAFD